MKKIFVVASLVLSTSVANAEVNYCGKENRSNSAGEVMLKSLMVEAAVGSGTGVSQSKSEKAACYHIAKLNHAVSATEFRAMYDCGSDEAQLVWDVVFQTADLVTYCDVGFDVDGVTERSIKTVGDVLKVVRAIHEAAVSLGRIAGND
jgi:hypothetical protein